MTVVELISELNKIEDKELLVQDLIGEIVGVETISAEKSLIHIPYVLIN